MTEDTKKSRDTLTTRQRYDLMHAIVTRYAAAGQTDGEFAAAVSKQVGATISASSVAHYRDGLGIERYKAEPASVLRARIAALEAKLLQQALPLGEV
jgi:hypothetical protein